MPLRGLIGHGDNGLLVPLHNSESFVAQARGLARQADRGATLGRAARQTALAQLWHGVVAQVEALNAGRPGPTADRDGAVHRAVTRLTQRCHAAAPA